MSKHRLLRGLQLLACSIVASGLGYSVFSYKEGIRLSAFNTVFPAWIIGLVAAFLGFRYLRSLSKLKKKIEDPGLQFSWKNFKKNQQAKKA